MGDRICPFCHIAFRCLGKHLASCPSRQNRPYDHLLAKKSGKKSLTRESTGFKKCHGCGKEFKRLDVHFRWNTSCRDPLVDKSSVGTQLRQQQHSEFSTDARPNSHSPPSRSISVVVGNHIPSGNVQPSLHSLSSDESSSCASSLITSPLSPPGPSCTTKVTGKSSTTPPASSESATTTISHNIKVPIKLLKANETHDWLNADNYIRENIIPKILAECDLSRKAILFSDSIYTYFASEFGTVSHGYRRRRKRQKLQNDMEKMRQQKNQMRREYRAAIRTNQPKEVIARLASAYHRLVRSHSALHRQKVSSDTYDRLQKERRSCRENPWKFAKHLLDDDGHANICPSFSKDEANTFFHQTYSCVNQEPITSPSWASTHPIPNALFDTAAISREEIVVQIRKSRSGSAPCPFDQVSYKIFKKCPSVIDALLNIFNHCLYQASIPNIWKVGVTRLLGKPAAKVDPKNPSNFRPITLTPCTGKLFTSILKERLLSYMKSNSYLDTSIQKAFVNNVPGCLEHQVKLFLVIQEARSQQRSLAVCWIDLANAFGSVDHQLILFVLHHYHLPHLFVNLVENFYTNLFVIVSCRAWETDTIPINIGIFQGDPLSVIIFNLVVNLLVEFIVGCYGHLGYSFAGSNHCLPLLQYADDSCLIANSVENCQLMCTATEKWLHWARMKAKVPKCRSLALKRGKPCACTIFLNSLEVPSVGDEIIKFLGMPLSGTLSDDHQRDHLQSKLHRLLTKVDNTLLSRQQKLKLYKIGICPRLHWDLMVIQLPLTWIERVLDPLATSFLKKWSGLCKSANPSILFLHQEYGGLNLPSVSTTFKKFHVSRMSQLMMSTDSCIRFISTRMIQHEECTSGRAFLPAVTVRDTLKENPGLSRSHLKRLSSMNVIQQDNSSRLHYLQSLEVQGQCFRLHLDSFDIWSSALTCLPDALLKFSLNAMLDCLPHNQNLSKWGKVSSSKCPLCGEVQSLCHILNSCTIALRQRRYDQRHNLVLQQIVDFLHQHTTPDTRVTADLPNEDYTSHPFMLSNLKPDIIMWNAETKSVSFLELTVCFDTNAPAASQRKTIKYAELVEVVNSTSQYTCHLYTIQVGSRGLVDIPSFKQFLSLAKCTNKTFHHFLTSLSMLVIEESFKIYCRRNSVD